MNTELSLLLATAASIGLVHTLIGPDHYLPFVVMSKARNWSLTKTIWITLACGVGHVASSVVLGFAGIAAGVAVDRLVTIEGIRGNLAAWAMIAFGILYAVWGLRRAYSKKAHTHLSGKLAGITHVHARDTAPEHDHSQSPRPSLTPWVLFTVFVLGPCEPLIPILMYPAAQHDWSAVILVASVFGVITIGTMTAVVVAASYGARFLRLGKVERFSHALAGATIALSGLAIQILGL